MKKQTKNLVINEKLVTVSRKETGTLVSEINGCIQDTQHRNFLIPVRGIAGAGKTFIALEACGELTAPSEDGTILNENVFIAYIDLSDCADEVAVYYKIAQKLDAFYEKNPALAAGADRQEAVKQFLQLFQWIHGVNPVSVPELPADKIHETAEAIAEMIDKDVSESETDDPERCPAGQGAIRTVYSILGKIADKIPLIHLISVLAQVKAEQSRAVYLKHLMQEMAEAFLVKKTREIMLRDLLIYALTGNNTAGADVSDDPVRCVFFLDNFQLNTSSTLGRDHTWLSAPGGLISLLDAVWVIIGRRKIQDHFNVVFDGMGMTRGEIVIQGLDAGLARQYICNNCAKWDGATDEEYNGVVEKILEVCGFEETIAENAGDAEEEEEETRYLPYLLRLVVLHYRKLLADPSVKITSDAFAKLKSKEEFFGYYFYQDLSDLMINAFQILSCILVWDPVWIDLVRERFDNHLLNATNVLLNTAPVETKENGYIKLHEAVKDGLYNSTQNYIKRDVLKYLFESFIQIYGDDRAKENSQMWYDAERMNTFMELVAAYLYEIGEDAKSEIKKLVPVMKKLYEYHHRRENVTDSFIRVYTKYSDAWKEAYGIPFLNLEDHTFGNGVDFGNYRDELSGLLGGQIPDENIWEGIPGYMQICFNLADLYTDNSQTDVACQIEELVLIFLQKLGTAYSQKGDRLKEYKCRQQAVKAYNALAYDCSAEHGYERAYEYGSDGMRKLEELAEELIRACEKLSEHEKYWLRVIVRPEAAEGFWVNEQLEISAEVYRGMVDVYKKLIELNLPKNEEEKYKKTGDERAENEEYILSVLLLENQKRLRGNIGWYAININMRRDNDTVLYGARNYWMRKAIVQAMQEIKQDPAKEDLAKKLNIPSALSDMETSYHNVCVYLYKTGEIQKACLLEHDVLEQSRNLLPRNGERQIKKLQQKIKEIVCNKEADNLLRYLLLRLDLTAEGCNDLCSIPRDMVEQMQYLGDYYLHMDFYTRAFQYLAKVMLWRGIQFQTKDSKILDTLPRLLIASYGSDEEAFEMVRNHVEILVKTQENLSSTQTGKREEQRNITSRGVLDKLQCLSKLLQIVGEEAADAAADKQDKLSKMLDVVDGKEV